MNDLALHEPINQSESQAADVLQDGHNHKDDEDTGPGLQERTSALIAPARWWYASTAIPLIAGESFLSRYY